MSTGWSLEPSTLARALARWEATNPTRDEREHLHDWLMDMALDPFVHGEEDGATGMSFDRIEGTTLGVIYVIDVEARIVSIIDVAS